MQASFAPTYSLAPASLPSFERLDYRHRLLHQGCRQFRQEMAETKASREPEWRTSAARRTWVGTTKRESIQLLDPSLAVYGWAAVATVGRVRQGCLITKHIL